MENEESKMKMKKFIKKHWSLLVTIIGLLVLICFALLLIPESQMPTMLQSSGLVAIISAFLGVIMTVAVTTILLEKQSEAQKELLARQSEEEEKKDRKLKVFERKQEVYHCFLENLKLIIQDGEIKIGVKNEDGKIDKTIDGLKDMIFQLGYLQMHTTGENIKKILSHIAKMIQILNDFNSTPDEKKQGYSAEFYSKLSEELFEIVAILKTDLYEEECETIPQEYMTEILEKCDLYVETNDLNKHEIQIYFWEKLINQLKNKGYKVEEIDVTQMVNEYYAAKTKWSGTLLELEECSWTVCCEGHDFFYGLKRKDESDKDAELEQCIQKVSPLFKPNKSWYAWKYPDRYKLNFINCNSPEFEDLKNPRKRDKFIIELADEIDRYVKKFREIAKKTNL